MSVSLDDYFGTLLIGTYVNLLLFGLEILLFMQYRCNRTTRKNDGRFLQALIAFAFFNDLVGTSAECMEVYRYLINYHGNIIGVLTLFNWALIIYFFSTSISGFVVHSWMVWRYFRLSKRIVISIVLAAVMLLAFLTSVATGILTITSSQAPDYRSRLRVFVIISLASYTVVDLAIAVALIWELWRVQPVFRSTKYLVRKLTMHAIQTGVATFVVSLATGISYLVNEESNISGAIAFSHGRIYTCTMLFALNHRASLREGAGALVCDFSLPTLKSSSTQLNEKTTHIPSASESSGSAKSSHEDNIPPPGITLVDDVEQQTQLEPSSNSNEVQA
ncbi:hypothetical protein HGRIS_000164 [Hohenbuehelia grisea]|uniref:DUF6534 domain-containing protein n=1 Tax=Hohenbuehelia grisea TaxID=104357 RepID=A0ABR3JS68_9AGAR